MDGGGVEVAAQRPDGAAVGPLGVGDRDLRAFLLLVGFRAADRDEQATSGVKVEVLDVERDELGAPQRCGEPEQQQRPVAQAGERGGVDRLHEPGERLELERTGLAQRADAALAAGCRPGRRRRRPSRTAWARPGRGARRRSPPRACRS